MWISLSLYHVLPLPQCKPPVATAAQRTLNSLTGADEALSNLLTFPTTAPDKTANWESHAVGLTNLRVSTDLVGQNSADPSIRIQSTPGEIQFDAPSFRPENDRMILRDDKTQAGRSVREFNHPISLEIEGTYWEADVVGGFLLDGEILPGDEMIAVMKVMDEAQRQGGLSCPDRTEGTIYSSS